MKTKLGTLIFLLAATLAQAQTNNLTALLQQSLFEEQANRNLDAAIADYQSLATQFDKDRQLAATAIFRLGECYRMQGRTNEAALEYKRIVNEFSDQAPLATLSRQNLAGLGPVPAETAPSGNSDTKLWDKVKNLTQPQLEKILPTLIPDAMLTGLLQQRGEVETKLAQLGVDYSTNYPDYMRQEAVLKTVNRQISEKIDGMMQALKMRAELPRTAVAAVTPSTDEEQEIRRIQAMIQDSPDLINSTTSGATPLSQAARAGWFRVVTFLLDHGANINLKSGGQAPLHSATESGNKAMVELLLSRGADVNATSGTGGTSLHIAVENGFLAVAEVLLAHHADLNARNSRMNGERTPLHLAVERGNVEMLKLLSVRGADTNAKSTDGSTPLYDAASNGQLDSIKTLLAAKADPDNANNKGRTPLSYAAESGSPETVKILLDAKADPNGGKLDAPLLCAIHKNDAASAELLLQAGAKPNAIGEFDLPRQSGFGGRRGGPFGGGFGGSTRSVTPLWFAISENQFPMVQLLLKVKADPNDSQTDGQSLLFSALSDTNILEALLDAGAKVDVMGVSPNARVGNNAVNWTPLGEAVQQNNAAAVETLLKHGANPNVRDPISNFTPLHWAANNLADRKVFELLLAYKADRNVRDASGQTPLEILKEKTKPDNLTTDSPKKKALAGELADLLRQHGALDNPPDWDCITVSQPSVNSSGKILRKGTNDWNHFTLLELIWRTYDVNGGKSLYFSDLSRVVVMRPDASGAAAKRTAINLLNATNSIDFQKDIPLEFGDVVEIPERGHTLAEQDTWIGDQMRKLVGHFREHAGEARLVVAGGQTIQMPLNYFIPTYGYLGNVLKSVQAQHVLTSGSNLSRVKVTRRDVKTKKTNEWILDCSLINHANGYPYYDAPGLLLRDGDLIEVPEKP